MTFTGDTPIGLRNPRLALSAPILQRFSLQLSMGPAGVQIFSRKPPFGMTRAVTRSWPIQLFVQTLYESLHVPKPKFWSAANRIVRDRRRSHP